MKIGFVIGRFQVPGGPHSGHMSLFRSVLEENDALVVIIGSANRSVSVKNPYSYQYRLERLLSALQRTEFVGKNKTVLVFPVNDYLYNDSQWITDVHAITTKAVESLTNAVDAFSQHTLRLYGHFKEGNDYLKWFPSMEFVNVTANDIEISGTAIRKEFKRVLPKSVQDDMDFYEKEKVLFQNYPFPETLNFNCADAVVECLGHVLLIKRKFAPGAGTWALPGGFKNRNETFKQAALRELYEETNIRVPQKVMQGSIKHSVLFDHIGRSNGIPRNTLAVHYIIAPNPDNSLPRANGGDDASEAMWVPIAKALNEYPLYDDHSDILSEMTGIRPAPALSKFGHSKIVL